MANNLFQSATLRWMPEIRAAGRLRTAIVQNHDTHDIHASHDNYDVHESGNTCHNKQGTSKNTCIVLGVQSGLKTTVTSHGLSLEDSLASVEN